MTLQADIDTDKEDFAAEFARLEGEEAKEAEQAALKLAKAGQKRKQPDDEPATIGIRG